MLEDLLLLGGVEGEFSDMIRGRKFLALREMVVVVEEEGTPDLTRFCHVLVWARSARVR